MSGFLGSSCYNKPPVVVTEEVFLIPGTFLVEVPAGTTTMCCVAVGAGSTGLGSGGGLAYTNDINVTPGEILTVVVAGNNTGWQAGAAQEWSSVQRGNTFLCQAGSANSGTGTRGGKMVGTGGASGGFYGPNGQGRGGGGAAGYLGNGGVGGGASSPPSTVGGAGAGGGGAGGNGGVYQGSRVGGAGGGGTGIYGIGADGSPGSNPATNDVAGGGGGSTAYGTGTAGSNATGSIASHTSIGHGGFPGGGSGHAAGTGPNQGLGGTGAVRLVYGAGRSFPYNAA